VNLDSSAERRLRRNASFRRIASDENAVLYARVEKP
jgi:hypothetical protein